MVLVGVGWTLGMGMSTGFGRHNINIHIFLCKNKFDVIISLVFVSVKLYKYLVDVKPSLSVHYPPKASASSLFCFICFPQFKLHFYILFIFSYFVLATPHLKAGTYCLSGCQGIWFVLCLEKTFLPVSPLLCRAAGFTEARR